VSIENVQDFLDKPDPLWLFDRLLPQGELAFIYGPPGSYKSFAMLAMCAAITKAAKFGGKAPSGSAGAFLYLAAEGVHGVRQRVRALVTDLRMDVSLAYMDTSGVQFQDGADRRELVAQLLDLPHRPRIIAVDTFARHGIGVDENSSRDTGVWIGGFEMVLAAVGATGLVSHHSGKDVDRGLRGSSALLGAASTVIRADRQEESLSLICEKQRDYDERWRRNIRIRRRITDSRCAAKCPNAFGQIRFQTAGRLSNTQEPIGQIAAEPDR
jgi:hypothetical protein